MFSAFIIALAGFFSWLMLHQPGDKVVVKAFSKIVSSEKTVDEVGPGQVLTVLKQEGDKLWVSRGVPGWIPSAAVIELGAAEAFFDQRFKTGAGASDYLARGNVRIAKGNTSEGVSDLKRAVQLANDKLPCLEALGYGLMAAQDQVEAIHSFTEALALKSSASAYMGRGLAYYQLGDNPNAESDFVKAIELSPEHAFPRKYYGALLHDLGKLEESKKQLQVALQQDSLDLFTRKAAARLLYDMFLYPDCLKQFDFVLSIDPKDIEAMSGRGVVLHAIGKDLQGAETAFRAAIALTQPSPENAYLWSNLGQVQHEIGKIEESLRSLEQAIALDSDFTEARSHRAFIMAEVAQTQDAWERTARSDLEAVFKSIDARTYWDYRALAKVNALLGDFERAIRFQTLACKVVRETGPTRFTAEADAALEKYQQQRADKK